jgi:hypothetical protein
MYLKKQSIDKCTLRMTQISILMRNHIFFKTDFLFIKKKYYRGRMGPPKEKVLPCNHPYRRKGGGHTERGRATLGLGGLGPHVFSRKNLKIKILFLNFLFV